MSNNIYLSPTLINFKYLAAYSPIPVNFNYEDIRPFVKISESIWIEPVLGSALYNELLKEVKNNNVTDVNSTLLLHIYELESIAVIFEAMPFLTYQVNEKGITKSSSDNTESIDVKEFAEIKNDLRAKIEVLSRNLTQFLEKNKECYPLYVSIDCSCNMPNDNWMIYGSNKRY